MKRVPLAPPAMHLVLIYLLVVVFQLYAAHGFEQVHDLHEWDECVYQSMGRDLFRGSPDWRSLVAWSGPYQVLYGFLDLADLGTNIQDAMCLLLALASSLALLWALSGVASLEAAAAATLLWASGSAYVGAMNGVYNFGATVLCLAAGLLARGREISGATLALVAAATRPELLFWMGGAGLLAAVLGKRRAGLVVAVGAATLLVLQLAMDDRDRSGMAFRQHYALGAAERDFHAKRTGTAAEGWAQHAFINSDQWVRESFGDAATLSSALAANPQEVGRHMLWNLRGLAYQLLPLAGRFPASLAMRRSVAVALGLLAAVGLADLLRALRRRRAFRGTGSTWIAALVLTSPLVAVTSILYGDRLAYLVGGFLVLAILALRGARSLRRLRVPLGARVRGPRLTVWTAERIGLARGDLGVLGLAALLLVAVSVPRPSDRLPDRLLKWRRILAAVERDGGRFAVLPDPSLVNVLLPPGSKLSGLGKGIPDDVHRVLLHALDFKEYRRGALLPAQDEQLRRILEDGGWRPLRYSDEVLLLAREGT